MKNYLYYLATLELLLKEPLFILTTETLFNVRANLLNSD